MIPKIRNFSGIDAFGLKTFIKQHPIFICPHCCFQCYELDDQLTMFWRYRSSVDTGRGSFQRGSGNTWRGYRVDNNSNPFLSSKCWVCKCAWTLPTHGSYCTPLPPDTAPTCPPWLKHVTSNQTLSGSGLSTNIRNPSVLGFRISAFERLFCGGFYLSNDKRWWYFYRTF